MNETSLESLEFTILYSNGNIILGIYSIITLPIMLVFSELCHRNIIDGPTFFLPVFGTYVLVSILLFATVNILLRSYDQYLHRQSNLISSV